MLCPAIFWSLPCSVLQVSLFMGFVVTIEFVRTAHFACKFQFSLFMGFAVSVEFVRTALVRRFWSAVGDIWRARPVKDQCFFLGLEVVEHLVMSTAPPCGINGVYWSNLVCMGLYREVALFLVQNLILKIATTRYLS